MKKTALITILLVCMPVVAGARDFWTIYGEHMVYNYAIKAGTGASQDFNHRLSSDEILAVASKSFSQSMGIRFSEIARSRRGIIIVCIFSREPERCYLDVVMKATFDEVQFMNAPGFSQKTIKRLSKIYVGGLFDRNSFAARKTRSMLVPPWKKFNPQFGFSPTDMEIVMSTPFYSFRGIYVEPQYGTRKGASLGFMKDRWFVDIFRNNATIGYRFPNMIDKKFNTTVTLRKGEIKVENTLLSF